VTIDWTRPSRQPGWVDAVGLAGLLGFLVARFIPIARLPFWGCALRRTTGWPCPGCGLTRVADRMSHFNVVGAWEANPLGTVAAAAFALAIVASFLHLAFKLPLPRVTLSPRELRLAQVLLGLAALANYLFVILKTRFPELL
jgi:hypothetical protein